jgi:hypothetical protein
MEASTPVKVLRYLVENQGKSLDMESIIFGIDAQEEDINLALDRLTEMGILIEEEDRYMATQISKGLSDKMLRLYGKIRRPFKDEIFANLVSKIGLRPDELGVRLRAEGFEEEEIKMYLERGIEKILSEKLTDLSAGKY